MSKVVVMHCEDYDEERIYSKINEGICRLGGIKEILQDKTKLLLKPNMLAPAIPAQAVTTHPAILLAVARLLRENGYSNVSYGDSPAASSPEVTSQITGLGRAARHYGVPLADFNNGRAVNYPLGKICNQFHIANGVLDADCIISLSKLKTHILTGLTGAIKNQFGCVYQCKSSYHRFYSNRLEFCQMLIDLNMLLKPQLYIMDAIVSMEGNGPYSGTPKLTNAILLSVDPVALDYVAGKLIGLADSYQPLLKLGKESGLGTYGSAVEIESDKNFDSMVIRHFKKRNPTPFERLSQAIMSDKDCFKRVPVIDANRCVQCGKCLEICPAPEKAIMADEKKMVIRYKNCIKCYCCQEICPHQAITLHFFHQRDNKGRKRH